MALFATHWPRAGPAAFHMANLTGLDVAMPSTRTGAGGVPPRSCAENRELRTY